MLMFLFPVENFLFSFGIYSMVLGAIGMLFFFLVTREKSINEVECKRAYHLILYFALIFILGLPLMLLVSLIFFFDLMADSPGKRATKRRLSWK